MNILRCVTNILSGKWAKNFDEYGIPELPQWVGEVLGVVGVVITVKFVLMFLESLLQGKVYFN